MVTEANMQEFIKLRKELIGKEFGRLNPQQKQAVFQIKVRCWSSRAPGPVRLRYW